MKSTQPKVSIVIATYNVVADLEKTLISILAQDYAHYEIIIIDGESNDGTQEIIRQYSRWISTWISEPDNGIADAFNKGVIRCTGDYINFQGAGDCLVGPNVLGEVMAGVDQTRDVMLSARVARVTNDNARKVLWIAPKKFTSHFSKYSLLFRMSLPHQGLFVHKNYFRDYGFFDTSLFFSMDYEHLLRSFRHFPNVVMKNTIFSSWQEGGVGTNRDHEILREYNSIKVKNKVAPAPILFLINKWCLVKLFIKKNSIRLKSQLQINCKNPTC